MINLKEGENAAKNIILLKIVLFSLQVVVGTISGSIAILVAAVDSISDIVGLSASWFGLKLAQRPADERFPYGYYKAENLATALVSFIILYWGFEFFNKGISAFTHPTKIQEPIMAMTLAFFSIFLAIFLVKYLEKTAKRINSSSMMANAKEKRIDVISSALVFIAIFANDFLDILYLESVVTILLSLWVIKYGIETSLSSIYALMDVSPSDHFEATIKRILYSKKPIKKVKKLKLRKSGPLVFGEVEIEIDPKIDVFKSHRITEEIDRELKSKIPELGYFSVHVEPAKSKKIIFAVPVQNNKGILSNISSNFAHSPFFLFATLTGKKISLKEIVPNPFKTRLGTSHKVADLIAEKGADVVAVPAVSEVAFHALRDQFVNIYRTKGRTAREVANNYLKRKLTLIVKPNKK